MTAVVDEFGLLPEELIDIPTFKHTPNCDKKLIQLTRILVRKRYKERPESFYKDDINLLMTDDWAISRFLLRCRLEPIRTCALIEDFGKFRQKFKMGQTKLTDFPAELYSCGPIFQYAPDKAGNVTFWMRAKCHERRDLDLDHIVKQFLLCILEQCDRTARGRGVTIVFDFSKSGMKNTDLAFTYWLLSSFRNYCPKGLSYILVYNLSWVLNVSCQLALSWISPNNKKRLRFIEKEEIFQYINKENVPDFIEGGECKIDYSKIPDGCKPVQAQPNHKLVPIKEEVAIKIRELTKPANQKSSD